MWKKGIRGRKSYKNNKKRAIREYKCQLVTTGQFAFKKNWVYFDFNGALYKCKADGSDLIKIYEIEEKEYKIIHHLNIVKDWIYFSAGNGERDGLYKIKTDGTNLEEIISDGSGGCVLVVGDTIYYQNKYELNCNGTADDKKENLALDVSPYRACNWFEGYFYYCATDEEGNYNIYKVKPDGIGKEVVSETEAYHMVVSDDGWIYYCDESLQMKSAGGSLQKMRIDGTENQIAVDDSMNGYTIDGEYIYYYLSQDGEDDLYRVKTDGTE